MPWPLERPDQGRCAVVAAERAADLDRLRLPSLGEVPLSIRHVVLPHDEAVVVGEIVRHLRPAVALRGKLGAAKIRRR